MPHTPILGLVTKCKRGDDAALSANVSPDADPHAKRDKETQLPRLNTT